MKENLIEKVNGQLPETMKLIDCTNAPLVGMLWGKRNNRAYWKIESIRKVFWFSSIAAIHRWMHANGYSDHSGQDRRLELKSGDVITYAQPKRFCYSIQDGMFYCIIPAQNTWGYRKKGKCSKCEEILKYSYVEGSQYLYNDGMLILDMGDKENKRLITLISRTYGWRAEKVDRETLLSYQLNDYPE